MEAIKDLINLQFQEKVEIFIDDVFAGRHHLRKIKTESNHVCLIPFMSSASTFDDSFLTKIVISSHKLGLRAEMTNNGLRGLKILLHNRIARTGKIWERHPTLLEVLNSHSVMATIVPLNPLI